MENEKKNCPISLAETLLSEYATEENAAIIKQIQQYRDVYSIYERTQIILGRKTVYGSCNNSTEEVQLNFSNIGSTKTNISHDTGLA